MGIADDSAIASGSGECFNGRNATFAVRSVVVEMGRIRYSQWPESLIFDFGPVKGSVNHHSPSSGNNEANCRLGHSILPFGTDSTIPNVLVVTGYVMHKGLALEDSIVRVVRVYRDSV